MKFVIGTMFKRPALLLAVALPLGQVLAEDLPKPLNFARYQAMMDHSPFAIATAVAPPPSAPNFAKDLYIANATTARARSDPAQSDARDRCDSASRATVAVARIAHPRYWPQSSSAVSGLRSGPHE